MQDAKSSAKRASKNANVNASKKTPNVRRMRPTRAVVRMSSASVIKTVLAMKSASASRNKKINSVNVTSKSANSAIKNVSVGAMKSNVSAIQNANNVNAMLKTNAIVNVVMSKSARVKTSAIVNVVTKIVLATKIVVVMKIAAAKKTTVAVVMTKIAVAAMTKTVVAVMSHLGQRNRRTQILTLHLQSRRTHLSLRTQIRTRRHLSRFTAQTRHSRKVTFLSTRRCLQAKCSSRQRAAARASFSSKLGTRSS
jgi:hypothetical protein